MRGEDHQQGAVFSYVMPEQRVPQDHPLRPIRAMVDEALAALSPRFASLYAKTGRPSIAPEKLLRALLLQVLYTVRSERMLMEQLDYNLLFRWFVGLGMDDAVWDATVFSKNRDRLLEGDVAQAFFAAVLSQARERKLLSSEHFTVDGTLIEAWAGLKSFRKVGAKRRDADDDPGNPTVNFRGEKRSNDTHRSTTDGEALLARMKGAVSALAYRGHLLTENRNGLVVEARVTPADGYAERAAALAMLDTAPRRKGRITLGADRGYDVRSFVAELRERRVTPHVAQNTTDRASAIDARTTRAAGYVESQRRRKRIEEVFGWMKTVGPLRKTKYRGRDRVAWMFVFAAAAYNLVRMRNLALAT
jgi:transposase